MVAEIIWESGEHSLANYDSEEEMFSAIAAQHSRAISGEKGGPVGHPALRAVAVHVYEKDPAEPQPALSLEVAKAEVNALMDEVAEGGVINLDALVEVTSRMRSAQVKSEPHESNYKAEAKKVYTIDEVLKAAGKDEK